MPLQTAAPEPPLDPPAERLRSYGFKVGGWMSGSVTGMTPSSLVAVFPRITNPAARRLLTVRSSNGEGIAGTAAEPNRVFEKRTQFRSLIPTGTPWKGGRGRLPDAHSRSFVRAS